MDPIPADLVATRLLLHAVAVERVAPPRTAATGRIDLRATPGGFGTPVFDGDREVRVDGAELVVTGRGATHREPLSGVPDSTARWLGRLYAMALDVLTEVARDMPRDWAPSCPKIWPEHFDYAIEAGTVRANLGVSPGDDEHPTPYAYVGPWEPVEANPLWNATAFPGAELPLTDLDGAPVAIREFFDTRLTALHAV